MERVQFTNEFANQLRQDHNLSILVVGPAGAGKSTISKRIVKRINDENKIAILISFHNVSCNQRWSLKNFLLKFPLVTHNGTEPTANKVDRDFTWISNNQDKVVLVMDGLDQSAFDISNNPNRTATVDEELLPGDLLALLLARQFLPGIRLILTSRPHSIVQFDSAIQPNIVLFVNHLLERDVDKLMRHYIPNQNVDRILTSIQTRSLRILDLMKTPLFLRLFATLYCRIGEDIWPYLDTTSKLFFKIIEEHQLSAHFNSDENVEVLERRLSAMAYDKTISGTIVFGGDDLSQYNLTATQVQDLVYVVPNIGEHGPLMRLVAFFFNHQAFQVREFLFYSFVNYLFLFK